MKKSPILLTLTLTAALACAALLGACAPGESGESAEAPAESAEADPFATIRERADYPEYRAMYSEVDNIEVLVFTMVDHYDFQRTLEDSGALPRSVKFTDTEKVQMIQPFQTITGRYLSLVEDGTLDNGASVMSIAFGIPGYFRDRLEEIPFLETPVFFMVGLDNPVENLSEEEIRAIYRGDITNWKEVGGEDVKISIYAVSEYSTQDFLHEQLFGADRPRSKFASNIMRDWFANDHPKDGISASVDASTAHWSDDNVAKIITVNGAKPTTENIAAGAYPFAATEYLYFSKDLPEDSAARELAAFLTGDDGDEIIRRGRYVYGIQDQLPYGEPYWPRLDGSTAVAPLLPLALEKGLGASPEIAARYGRQQSNTYACHNNLYRNEADLIIHYEREWIGNEYFSVDDFETKAIGVDALVFLVSGDNPVENVTSEQLYGIYSGEITNWKELGGKDETIQAYQRNWNSGSQTLLRKLVMNGEEPMEAPGEWEFGGMEDVLNLFEYDGGTDALGFSVYYFVEEMNSFESSRLLAVDGVAPSRETIADGSYPLCSPFYTTIMIDSPEGGTARQLYDWLSSPDGQQTIAEAGHIPIGSRP